MPAITGPVQVIHIGGGVLQFGDSAVISPKNSTKAFEGSGSSNSGAFVFNASGLNGTNVLDVNGIDQPIAGNN